MSTSAETDAEGPGVGGRDGACSTCCSFAWGRTYSKYNTEKLCCLTNPTISAIPAPAALFVPRWGADPRFRGAYANWPANFLSEHQANLRADVGGRLWFAGEATSQKYFGVYQSARG